VIPTFVRDTLDDLAARRLVIDATEASIRALYGIPAQSDPDAEVTIEDEAPKDEAPGSNKPRRRRAAAADGAEPASEVEGKYDATIRRVLRNVGAIGAPVPDMVHAYFPHGRYTAEQKHRAHCGISHALKQLEKRGEVTREGRIWRLAEAVQA
jgi:hypothetical protein